MSRLLPTQAPDFSKLERVADLFKLRDHLLSSDEKTRFICLYYYVETQKYCTGNCEGYIHDHNRNFKNAGTALVQEVDTVKKTEFIAVLRTFFCGVHDPIKKKYKAYKVHFETLWEGASRELQSEVWDALRKSGRGIYPPSTPQRPSLSKHATSAPAILPEKASMAAQGSVPSLLNVDSATPSRPRTAQASLGSIAEPSEDDLPMAPPTPTPGPGCIPIVGDICTSTSPPTLLPSRSKPGSSPFGNLNQMAEDAKCESIWDRLGKNTKGSVSADSETTENGKQSPTPTPQTERCFKESPTQALKTESEPQATWSTRLFQEKPPVAPEHGSINTMFKSPIPLPKDWFIFLKDSPTPESPTVETNPPPSENTPFPDETPVAEKCKAAISPAQKRTPPKPCAYKPEQPGVIASMIRDILKRDIEERTGAVYVLQAPEFFSNFSPARSRNEKWVKIGISSDVKSRVKSLEATCGITNLEAVHVSHSGTMKMQLLRRIEALCHAELNNFRRRMDCENTNENSKCDKVHEEWFAVETAVAIRTVKRWTKFLGQDPYGEHGGLTDFWRGRLAKGKYCEFDVSEGDADHELVHRGFDAWLEESIQEKKQRGVRLFGGQVR